MKMEKYWFLGFLGFVGFFTLSEAIAAIKGEAAWYHTSNFLWFLWFTHFVPHKIDKDDQANLIGTDKVNDT